MSPRAPHRSGRRAGESTSDDAPADICVYHLTELPKNLWKSYSIDGPLGNTPEANQRPLHGSPPPEPQSELCLAVASGNTEAVCGLLNDMSLQDITKPDDINGNTALIYASVHGAKFRDGGTPMVGGDVRQGTRRYSL